MHDPNAFVDPFKYKPERYLKDADDRLDNTVRSLGAAVFGFGRRLVVVVVVESLRTWFRNLIAFLLFFGGNTEYVQRDTSLMHPSTWLYPTSWQSTISSHQSMMKETR